MIRLAPFHHQHIVTTILFVVIGVLLVNHVTPIIVGDVDTNVVTTDDTPDKVQVELYLESQCPDCREMITTSFYDAYEIDGFLDMADITFIPFGNANETKDEDYPDMYTFECQHGESECMYNLIETCAIHKIATNCDNNPMMTQFQFIYCIEQHNDNRDTDQDYESVALKCATQVGVSIQTIDDIKSCVLTKEGNIYEHAMAQKTAALNPPHTYVPYVVANGVHNDEIQNDVTDSLFDYVCRTYKGQNKSTYCPTTTSNKYEEQDTITTTTVTTNNVCYRDNYHMYDFGSNAGTVATTVNTIRRRLHVA